MSDCLFCQMVAGIIPVDKVYEDERHLAFRDINPQAPHHVLVIPKRHVASSADLGEQDRDMMGGLCLCAARVAAELGLDADGYRWVINCGAGAGQTVPHIHLHLLGGRALGWPPG